MRSEVSGALNAAVMRRFERVVALPDPKNVDFTQPNQQLGSNPIHPERLRKQGRFAHDSQTGFPKSLLCGWVLRYGDK
jgi:hypothetical protein